MICVYDIGNENYTANGDAILTPTECKVKMVAGGQYNLNMTHPIDPWGKWEHLVPEAILKVPIPEEVIESAISGLDVDVYVTNTTATMYEGPNAPQRIYYPQFQFSGVTYVVGSKVSYVGHNWQMHTLDPQSEMGYNHPPNNYPEYWRRIADYTTGDPVLATFNPGTEVYLIEDAGDGWYHVMTAYGLTGYMQASQLTYDHHITPAETGPRIIREQLFRIRTADRNTKQNRVTVTAEHVSYDLAGVCGRCGSEPGVAGDGDLLDPERIHDGLPRQHRHQPDGSGRRHLHRKGQRKKRDLRLHGSGPGHREAF